MDAGVALNLDGSPGPTETGPVIGGQSCVAGLSAEEFELAASPQPKGFEDFYRAHYESLVRLGTLLTQSEEVARDLVQDVFARLYHRFEALEDPLPYVRRSVVNASRSWHRRRRLERRHAAEAIPDQTFEADELFDVLARLPARQRAAIVLRFYEQMSDAEIAAILHCRPGTVASLVHRGCARLRTSMEEGKEGA